MMRPGAEITGVKINEHHLAARFNEGLSSGTVNRTFIPAEAPCVIRVILKAQWVPVEDYSHEIPKIISFGVVSYYDGEIIESICDKRKLIKLIEEYWI